MITFTFTRLALTIALTARDSVRLIRATEIIIIPTSSKQRLSNTTVHNRLWKLLVSNLCLMKTQTQ